MTLFGAIYASRRIRGDPALVAVRADRADEVSQLVQAQPVVLVEPRLGIQEAQPLDRKRRWTDDVYAERVSEGPE